MLLSQSGGLFHQGRAEIPAEIPERLEAYIQGTQTTGDLQHEESLKGNKIEFNSYEVIEEEPSGAEGMVSGSPKKANTILDPQEKRNETAIKVRGAPRRFTPEESKARQHERSHIQAQQVSRARQSNPPHKSKAKGFLSPGSV